MDLKFMETEEFQQSFRTIGSLMKTLESFRNAELDDEQVINVFKSLSIMDKSAAKWNQFVIDVAELNARIERIVNKIESDE